MSIGIEEQIPQIEAACIVANVAAVMVIVIGGASYKREYSRWTPLKLIA